MIHFPSKQAHVQTTIFTKMSQLALDEGALNLSQGFPGFDCSEELQELLKFYSKGHNQYAPMAGVPALRNSIAAKTRAFYGIDLDANSEVTVVSGATEALFAAIHCCVFPGDEVIMFDPAYDAYDPIVRLAGGVPVHIQLKASEGFRIDWAELARKISPKTRAIMVNTPHNPTGSVWAMEDLDAFAEIVKGTNILIVSDEVYEHIVFDGAQHASVLLHPELRKRSFVCGSFGKTYHITGWKMGYCLAPEYLTSEFRKLHQWVTFSSATPLQYALADYLKEPAHYLGLSDFYQKKRDLFAAQFAGSRWKVLPSAGSFFQCLDYSGITDEADVDLAVRLTKELKVASIPVSVFYETPPTDRILRFCFAKNDDMLQEAAHRLAQL
ncbi:methionine aminotransferase [Aquirufa regiilacus]|uniref:Methionine aminotransferase n=1 Tax=Aquirufa regiilacus TaxID=3024868 RepID=A0ABU3TS93_9BACT|nr:MULTISPECIES: methionine aminotransferase [unclassified Aquirufa]MDT8886365.1 methionine aminotransferase [Aquirufa sp. LEPPI-3A]MDU0808695.1 methionine aminotransferase [Aquirufa sp. LEOWEIH-7C]